MPDFLQPEAGSFAALMEIYERNYIALRRLCPRLSRAIGLLVSQHSENSILRMRILAQTRYTTTLELAQTLAVDIEIPVLPVRVYHDARQAEVLILNWPVNRLYDPFPRRGKQRDLLNCWHANHFLSEWLEYCLQRSHEF